jgi:thiol-disulfide isomerase/thioredoxin
MVATRISRLAGAALLATGLFCVTACGAPGTAEADVSGARPAGGGVDEDIAPDFSLADLDGNEVTLGESEGRVRLIDFWATWCAPCREEIPMLKELDADYRDAGLTILAISDESVDEIREFVDKHEIPYTNLIGTEEVAVEYIVLGLPTGFLLDGEGRIIERFVGPKPRKVLEGRIRELLDLPPLT